MTKIEAINQELARLHDELDSFNSAEGVGYNQIVRQIERLVDLLEKLDD
jgi:uncharacterized protein (UPF0335 family)